MKTVTLYPYDPELRPGTMGADFEDGDTNHSYTLRYEREDTGPLMHDLWEWLFKEVE
jgi:hypothetical protein